MELLKNFGADYIQRVEQAIQTLKQGKGILMIDDEQRENEGDLIFPASTMHVNDMALMIRECSGIVCLCLTPEKANSLSLTPMVEQNTSKFQTAFTISIEAKEGVSTGVSAADRIHTIRTAIAHAAKPDDLSKPGHVFPLVADAQGVLQRKGHTEGSIDIVRLAGLGDAAVLCELTNANGTMARLPEIVAFAFKQGFSVVSVEDIFLYRIHINNNS